jgi:hypothetical protein
MAKFWSAVGLCAEVSILHCSYHEARFECWKADEMYSTIKVYYSTGDKPLKAVSKALPNDNAGGGQLQIGIAKKPTETETVVFDGYQEHIPLRGEGQIYGGIFVEDSSAGCVSM